MFNFSEIFISLFYKVETFRQIFEIFVEQYYCSYISGTLLITVVTDNVKYTRISQEKKILQIKLYAATCSLQSTDFHK